MADGRNDNSLFQQRYQLLSQVGKGGFGVIYKAADTRFGNRQVAIKKMGRKGVSPQKLAEATEAFKREAFLLARLVHPNLPRVYDFFYEDGYWYLVMDYIEGETLEAGAGRRAWIMFESDKSACRDAIEQASVSVATI